MFRCFSLFIRPGDGCGLDQLRTPLQSENAPLAFFVLFEFFVVVEYFGQVGVAEIEKAIAILNALPPASKMSATFRAIKEAPGP